MDSLCRWQVQVSVYCACCNTSVPEVHTVFNPVVPYVYLLPNMYLFIVDIAKPDLFVCCWT